MSSVRDVEAGKFIEKLKEELKGVKEIQPPVWAKFVKSGAHKERPPEQQDFWFIRASSILRRLYLNESSGAERLRTYFGGRKQYGHAPAHFKKASGSVIRKLLQQLESAGLVEKQNKKGRILSQKGKKLLDKIAEGAGK